jgi:hypothetical protein
MNLILITTIPHIIYYYIWNNPDHYIKIINKINYLDVNNFSLYFLYYISIFIKQLQLIYIIYNSYLNYTFIEYFYNDYLFLKLLIIIFGQILNCSVYYKLGLTGVYYGNKLGYPTKWIVGFPYNFCNNPQYIGSIMSYIGLYGITDIYYILYIILLYNFTIQVENNNISYYKLLKFIF